MAATDPIPSSRVKLFILPADQSEPIALGLVEDFSATKNIASENFKTVGSSVVPDNVSNIEEGRVRWGRVFTPDPQYLAAVAPRIAEWNRFESFMVLAIDPDTNDPIALAVGVRPESLDFTVRGGAAARSNYNGLCRYGLLGAEVKHAAA